MGHYDSCRSDQAYKWSDGISRTHPEPVAADGSHIIILPNRYKLHRDLLDVIHETYKRKNEAYGNSFDLSIDKYGRGAALVRIEDKKNRLDHLLLQGGEEHDEAVEDTCLDMANYCIMLAMYLTEHKSGSKPKRE